MNQARVAELADALDSKSSVRKDVWVRVPPLVLYALRGFRCWPDLREKIAVTNGPQMVLVWCNSEGIPMPFRTSYKFRHRWTTGLPLPRKRTGRQGSASAAKSLVFMPRNSPLTRLRVLVAGDPRLIAPTHGYMMTGHSHQLGNFLR